MITSMFVDSNRDHVVECSKRTVLSCLEPVCSVGGVSGDTSPIIWQRVKTGIFAQRAMVDQAHEGLYYRKET